MSNCVSILHPKCFDFLDLKPSDMFVSNFKTVTTLQPLCSETYADRIRNSRMRASVIHVVNTVSKDRLETSDQAANIKGPDQ